MESVSVNIVSRELSYRLPLHQSDHRPSPSPAALLESAGKAELAVGRGAAQFADTLDTHVVQELDQLLASYKEYEKVSKDADKARSNLEAKLAKVRIAQYAEC